MEQNQNNVRHNVPKVIISLVTLDGERYIDFCLESILNQTFQDFVIICLDNGSHDSTATHIYQKYPEVKLIKKSSNIGFAAAHNMIMRLSKSKYVFMVNQDMFFEPDYLEKIVAHMDAVPEIGSASGVLYKWNFDTEFETGKKTNIVDTAGLRLLKSLSVEEIYDEPVTDTIQVFGVSGAAPVYRRTALEDVMWKGECLDELFFSYKEDIDLAWRLQLHGWKSFIIRDAKGYHDRSMSRSVSSSKKWFDMIRTKLKDNKKRSYWSFRNHIFVFIKNVPVKFMIRWFFPLIYMETKRLMFAVFLRQHLLRAYIDVLGQCGVLFRKRRATFSSASKQTSLIKRFVR